MNKAVRITGLIHNSRRWDIVRIGESYFARYYGQGETAGYSDTGPYSTPEEAGDFVKAVRA